MTAYAALLSGYSVATGLVLLAATVVISWA
jgi:hypothetical protein